MLVNLFFYVFKTRSGVTGIGNIIAHLQCSIVGQFILYVLLTRLVISVFIVTFVLEVAYQSHFLFVC